MANQWDKIALKNIGKLTKVGKASFIAASQSVMLKSPVRDGYFKNNWFTEINGVSTKTINTADKSGTARMTEAESKAGRINIGDSISLANSSPYAIKLEYGHSAQAPNGMVRITAAQWPNTVATITRALKDD